MTLPRPARVTNKSPAPIQITADQILRESRDRHEAGLRPSPKKTITDSTELSDYRFLKRKEFENLIRRAECNKSVWIKYAKWEESQKNFAGARSVWERAMEVHYRDHSMWLKYVNLEMKNKFINHARNVWDRAVAILPRVDQLWYKYVHMEEMLGNVAMARQIFERWMIWRPDEKAWISYIEFEMRYNEIERSKEIFERFVQFNPTFSLENFDFEEQNDDRERTDDEIVGKRRFQHEEKEEVSKNRDNYDSWFDCIQLEESIGNKEKIREVYERAIANVPLVEKKQYWRLYIYLWINYALYEELDAQDIDRARLVYGRVLKLIPHKKFSFSKVWLLYAKFEIRHLNIVGARKILGNAIGMAPKDKIFNKYIEIELQLGNIDRCRKLYDKYVELSPKNCYKWRKYAEFEKSLSETERARAIFELAIAQPALDMPELLWQAYFDFEIEEGEFQRTRQLYARLLNRTKSLKVWISYAKFEASAMEEGLQDEDQLLCEGKKKCLERARRVFESAINYFKTSAPELKEERAILLEEWLNMESSFGELGDVDLVRVRLPKKRRHIETDEGAEELQASNLKILKQAYKWKKQKIASHERK